MQTELQGKYNEQSKLLKEASTAIKAADAEAKQRHQALLDVQCNKQQEFDQAIQGAVQQYNVQLNTAQASFKLGIGSISSRSSNFKIKLVHWK